MDAAKLSDEVRARAMRAFAGGPTDDAPGRPGVKPHWPPGAKDGIGAAVGGTSLVWFTIGRGSLVEVFYPSVDNACAGGLSLLVVDGRTFSSEVRHYCDHRVELPFDGVPLYHLINTCRLVRQR